MITPVHARLLTYYYPIGNTPAVCLTQALPPEQNARVLLIGCGDVRSILFTAHSDARPMDVTCCDIEPGILARNILLISLILDDADGRYCDDNWSIYYHLYISSNQLQRVYTQAKKLSQLSLSMKGWRESKYGKFVTFWNSDSLDMIRKIWDFWFSGSDNNRTQGPENEVKSSIKRAKTKRGNDDGTMYLSGLRSAAPANLAMMEDQSDLHKHFWQHGTIDTDHKKMEEAVFINPMFASSDDTLTLHYGTDPLLGFHTSLASVPFATNAPDSHGRSTTPHPIVASARKEFAAWSISFKQRPPGTFFLRCFTGDAIAFCHTLQSRHDTGANSACWYRDANHMEPLILEEDTSSTGRLAPFTFNVIDTSNLADHCGALNILIAASPLLDNDLASTLYTEVLAPQDMSRQDLVDNLLCGQFSTVSPLLGLLPVDYWTNTLPSSGGEDALVTQASRMAGPATVKNQLFIRSAWKRPAADDTGLVPRPSSCMYLLHFQVADLANILHRIYENMFAAEDLASMFQALDIAKLQKASLTFYRRPSFVSFLKLVKTRVDMDWDQVMSKLLHLIETNRRISMGMNYIQELYLYMHLLGVYSVDTFKVRYNTRAASILHGDVRDWINMPSAVCVTVKVPREKLAIFTEGNTLEMGTPSLHAIIQASSPSAAGAWHNIFSAVQLGFGHITPSGIPHSSDFKLQIDGDSEGWYGSSTLFVSFMVPSMVLLLEPRTAMVAFGVQSTPLLSERFLDKLGLTLHIFETTLGNKEHVYISKEPPNQVGPLVVTGFSSDGVAKPSPRDLAVKATIKVGFQNTDVMHLSHFTGRFDISSKELRSQLAAGCRVQATPLTAFSFTVLVGKTLMRLDFPLPVAGSQCKTRIARKSSYVELVVPVSSSVDRKPLQSLTYPVFINGGKPTSWNLPYINLRIMPALDISQRQKMEWLIMHASMALSKRERLMRDNQSRASSEEERTRMNLKDSMFSMFMQYSGLQGQKHHTFCLNVPTGGGVHIIIVVSAMRLDLSNRTVVLDTAVLSLYDALMPRLRRLLGRLTERRFINVKVDKAELRLWKQVLPACAERCRTWTHRAGCEYIARGKVPLSVEEGEEVLCSCGKGVFPTNFSPDIPNWKDMAQHAVRAAISPVFFCPLVEDAYDGSASGVAAPVAVVEDECRVCHQSRGKDGGELRFCSRCRKVKYCSRECQRADWHAHKVSCAT